MKVFSCLGAVPIQFAEERGWGPVTCELPFLGRLLGIFLDGGANILRVRGLLSSCEIPKDCFYLLTVCISNNKFCIRKFQQNGNKAAAEARLPPMMVGSVFFGMGAVHFWRKNNPAP